MSGKGGHEMLIFAFFMKTSKISLKTSFMYLAVPVYGSWAGLVCWPGIT